MGPRGVGRVAEEDRGDGGRGGPDLDEGLDTTGESKKRRGGNCGERGGDGGTSRCIGDLGRRGEEGRVERDSEYVLEICGWPVSTGAGRVFCRG